VSRAQIAAALTAAGLAGETARPATPAAGQAWPEWRASRWLNGCVTETGWYVYVVLPGDPRAAIDAGDPRIEPIGQALVDLSLRVEQVEPWRIPLGQNASESAPALRYSCTD
jgi:hypothetical protein